MNNFQEVYTEVMEITKVFAKNLRNLRAAHGLTADTLGLKVGVTSKHIYDMEKERRKPSLEILEKLSIALSVPIGALFYEDLKPQDLIKKEPVSVLANRLLTIPDRIYDLAQDLVGNKQAWEDVETVMEAHIKNHRKKMDKAKSKGA